jgi:hypothetical protein
MTEDRVRVVANSVPKSGTHLLTGLLTLLGFQQTEFGGIRSNLVSGSYSPIKRLLRARGQEKVTIGVVSPQQISRRWLSRRLWRVPDGCFITAHCIYTAELARLFREEQNMRVVCILRDPRDVAVSQMHYIKHRTQHFAHEAFLALPSDHERLLLSIRGGSLGGRKLQSLDERYRQFAGWERDPNALVIKFEELVGPKGGGSAQAQRRTVERVAEHVGLLGTDERTLGVVEEELFGAGRTFRKGQSGGWRSEFTEEHVRATKEVAGALLMELGYETDSDW